MQNWQKGWGTVSVFLFPTTDRASWYVFSVLTFTSLQLVPFPWSPDWRGASCLPGVFQAAWRKPCDWTHHGVIFRDILCELKLMPYWTTDFVTSCLDGITHSDTVYLWLFTSNSWTYQLSWMVFFRQRKVGLLFRQRKVGFGFCPANSTVVQF